MQLKNALIIFTAIFILASYCHTANGQVLYSYTDESGAQVFTNVPPIGEVSDLKMTGAIPSPPPSELKTEFESYNSIIEKYAADYQLPSSLIKSIITTESGFNPRAVSPKGARGLMQLMPATAARLGVNDSFDPEQNIHGGVKHFRSLMNLFNNDIKLSLAAYNAGENLVQRLGRVPDIKETREYVRSVTRLYDKNEVVEQAQEDANRPQTYRYVDESGVLHITNIPPSR